jgi:hypothetical protein
MNKIILLILALTLGACSSATLTPFQDFNNNVEPNSTVDDTAGMKLSIPF